MQSHQESIKKPAHIKLEDWLHEKLKAPDIDKALSDLLQSKTISSLAAYLGLAVSTLSIYCENKGLHTRKRHKEKLASNDDENIIKDIPLRNPVFFCKGDCKDYRPEELRGRFITDFCVTCERHHRQRRA